MKDLYDLFRTSLAGLRVLLAATLLLGLAYPLLITGVAAVATPWSAGGSLVREDGTRTNDPDEAVGSVLLGQLVEDDALFQPRPSAAGDGYDPLSTYGSNLGPESPELLASIEAARLEVAEREGVDVAAVPPDAVTASGSGLDPHISPAYADLQVARVAAANDLAQDEVRALVDEHTQGRSLGVLGEPRVDVLLLNIAVREAAGA
ncbi:K(+)-transporting ATPase subunit C [Nocardioides zeae]|uniref:Potassium-transporting ATPase KdpC subunit n=1 Tax=Nocardioides imazamoxiresistens TaxID=3231893 RepID=A0ABU3PT02_9ACTN|nr:K(+)-transporting ATPase subunit C [Nocardioides zeae]MDT9592355.1 K(+)-transporting ATPase subunit C [Nocardioides zeae]